MAFTNLEKIYYPKDKITKGDVIGYYRTVAPCILPHLKGRPVTLKRYPGGITKPAIYQRHLGKLGIKNKELGIKTVPIYVADKKAVKEFIVCNSTNALLYLAQLGTIELHPWYSRIHGTSRLSSGSYGRYSALNKLLNSTLNNPTFMVFDLDPPKKKFSREVIKAAAATKKVLDGFNLKSYVKTSGRSGLHIYVPLKPKFTYDKVRSFACSVGAMVKKAGGNVTLEPRIAKRGNAVFFDCNQNALSKSLVSVYSLRAHEDATVSFPLEWKNINKTDPGRYTIKTAPRLLKRAGDAWAGLLKPAPDDILPNEI